MRAFLERLSFPWLSYNDYSKTVGICGGFTTFSTFSKEALMMLHAGNFMSLMAYVAISVIAGIALVAAGYYLVRL